MVLVDRHVWLARAARDVTWTKAFSHVRCGVCFVFFRMVDGKVILVIELGPEVVEPCGSRRNTLVEKPLSLSKKYTKLGLKLIIVCITHIFYFLFILIFFFVRFPLLRRYYDRILIGTLPSENRAGMGGF